jgi:Arc-like DNA binding domain
MARRKPADTVHLRLRFPEKLRRRIEAAAAKNQQSMNLEIVERLDRSFQREDQAQLIDATAAAVAAKLTEPRADPSIGHAYLAKLVREFGSLSDGDPRKLEVRNRAREVRRWIKETELELEEMWKGMDEQMDEWDRIAAEDDAKQEAAMERLIEQRLRERQGKS